MGGCGVRVIPVLRPPVQREIGFTVCESKGSIRSDRQAAVRSRQGSGQVRDQAAEIGLSTIPSVAPDTGVPYD